MPIYKDIEVLNELRNKLSSLALSQYEINAYLTLLKSGSLSASELVKKSGIPHSRIYDVARKLSEKGLIEVIEGKPRRFKPVDPDIALRAFIEREKRRLEKTCNDVLKLISIYTLSGRLEDKTTWVVETKLIDIISPLVRKAKYQLLLASNPSLIDELKEEIGWASSRGVNTTIISYGDLKARSYLIERSIELYVRKASSLTIALIDSETGVISDPRINYSILTAEPILVRALMDLFYSSLVSTSTLISRPPILRGKFVSIWSVIHRLRGGERMRIRGIEVKSGREVIIEGVVKDKIIDEGIASIILDTGEGIIKVGGLGAILEDIEGLIFEVVS